MTNDLEKLKEGAFYAVGISTIHLYVSADFKQPAFATIAYGSILFIARFVRVDTIQLCWYRVICGEDIRFINLSGAEHKFICPIKDPNNLPSWLLTK